MKVFKQKIIGMTAKKMFNILRNSGSISFTNDVLGIKVAKIVDGETGKYVLPDGFYDYLPLKERGMYYKVFLDDGSDYTIGVDAENNNLIFNFNTSADKITGLRETVLSIIDYDYEKRYKEEELGL